VVNPRAVLVLLLSWPLGTTNRAAHPMHTTFTEIEQPVARGPVTVTIRGFEDDLTTAARKVSPERSPDSAIANYLRQRTMLTDRQGRTLPLGVVGLRRNSDVIWLTLRTEGPVDLSGSRFINSALTEVFHDQVNLVQVKTAGRRRTIIFTPGEGAKATGG
jgi:hypothetical protein